MAEVGFIFICTRHAPQSTSGARRQTLAVWTLCLVRIELHPDAAKSTPLVYDCQRSRDDACRDREFAGKLFELGSRQTGLAEGTACSSTVATSSHHSRSTASSQLAQAAETTVRLVQHQRARPQASH